MLFDDLQLKVLTRTIVGKVPIAISPKGTIVEDNPSTDDVIINAYYIPMAVLHAKCIFPCLMPSYRFVPDILENEKIGKIFIVF